MAEDSAGDGLRERLTRQGEDALGRLAQDLLENPLVNGAISRAFEAREKAAQAQEVAFGALNIPSASDLERLTRRVRSLSQRLEGIEDGVDRVDERLAAIQETGALDQRLSAIEGRLDTITKELTALRKTQPKTAATPAPAKRRPAAAKRAPRST
jgi:chromosome segregation ATPase